MQNVVFLGGTCKKFEMGIIYKKDGGLFSERRRRLNRKKGSVSDDRVQSQSIEPTMKACDAPIICCKGFAINGVTSCRDLFR